MLVLVKAMDNPEQGKTTVQKFLLGLPHTKLGRSRCQEFYKVLTWKGPTLHLIMVDPGSPTGGPNLTREAQP